MFDPLLNDLSKNTYTNIRDVVINVDTENQKSYLLSIQY